MPEFRFSGAATAVSISPTMLTEMNKTRQYVAHFLLRLAHERT